MRTLLVTGGAGFIGSHVAQSLIATGNRVVVLDNLATSKKSNIPKGAVFVKGDILSPRTVDRVFITYKPAVVLHIAGLASNINSFADPTGDARVNYIGTMRVVNACVARGVRRLIYASTMMVYGSSPIPFREPDTRPTSYYGISKSAAERFVHATAIRPDLPQPLHVTSLRMFNVYGPGQRLDNPYQGVLAIFIGNVLRGEPIHIFGSGRQSRDFIYIDDVVEAWRRVIELPKSFGCICNLGSGKQISIRKLADLVIRACGSDPKTYPIQFHPARAGDVQTVLADMRFTRNILKFRPHVSFEEGLIKTIAWARSTHAT